MLKQAIIVNKSLKLSHNQYLHLIVKGSIISIENSKLTKSKETNIWFKYGQKKITNHVKESIEISELVNKCNKMKINIVSIATNGIENKIPSKIEKETAVLVIGPDYDDKISKITGHLKLY